MNRIMRQLHTDHHHIQILLNCLSKEIDCYDFDSECEADITVILSILDYFHVYPNKWHHPSEDIIFKRLLDKKVKESKIIRQLQEEHNNIANETNKIDKLFCAVAEDSIVTASELVKSTRHFIALQRTHLQKENELIYPLMDKLFSAEEWKAIEAEVKIRDDPLFNKPSKSEYEHLYQYIMVLESEK